MKKQIAIILVCMLVTSISAMAGINTVKVGEIISGGTLDYDWTEYADNQWNVSSTNDSGVQVWVYRANTSDGLAYTTADTGTTNRGLMTARANVTTHTGQIPDYGFIFNYVNSSSYYKVGLVSNSTNTSWWSIQYWNGTADTNLTQIENDSAVVNVTGNWSVMKCIYNPYSGHLLFKAWDTTRAEPVAWAIDYTDATNLSTTDTDVMVNGSVHWGLFVNGTDDEVGFWGIGIYDLHYDTRTANEIPYIASPLVSASDYVDFFNASDIPTQITNWNRLDQQSWITYQDNPTRPIGNVYVFSAWNYSSDRIGFLIYNDNDNTNATTDWLAFLFDVNHNEILDKDDKFFYTERAIGPFSYRYTGTAWANTTGDGDISMEAGFTTTGLTRYDHTQWSVFIEASSVMPSTDLRTHANANTIVGLGIFGNSPAWSWNNVSEDTNESTYNMGELTGGMWNETEGDYQNSTPNAIGELGDFALIGWTRPAVARKFIDLLSISTIGTKEDHVIAYQSSIYKVRRYAIEGQYMDDENITYIRVPTTEATSFLGITSGTTNVESINFYGVNEPDYDLVQLSVTSKPNDNYSLDSSDVENYDAILVVPNPSFLDTNNFFYGMLYKRYAVAVK